eukprot:SAG11_NODE_6663_length_1271_cov_1.360068_2_plen_81_part_00
MQALTRSPACARARSPIVLRAAREDSVPNVKFNAAKTLAKMLPRLERSALETVRPCLEELTLQEDADVKYYAAEALKLCA